MSNTIQLRDKNGNAKYPITDQSLVIPSAGTSTVRAGITSPATGRMFFDTTLGKPVWYNGTNWVDATGTTV